MSLRFSGYHGEYQRQAPWNFTLATAAFCWGVGLHVSKHRNADLVGILQGIVQSIFIKYQWVDIIITESKNVVETCGSCGTNGPTQQVVVFYWKYLGCRIGGVWIRWCMLLTWIYVGKAVCWKSNHPKKCQTANYHYLRNIFYLSIFCGLHGGQCTYQTLMRLIWLLPSCKLTQTLQKSSISTNLSADFPGETMALASELSNFRRMASKASGDFWHRFFEVQGI